MSTFDEIKAIFAKIKTMSADNQAKELEKLTTEERKKLFDFDGSGVIDLNDLTNAMKIGYKGLDEKDNQMSTQEKNFLKTYVTKLAEEIITKMESDKNSKITFEDLVKFENALSTMTSENKTYLQATIK